MWTCLREVRVRGWAELRVGLDWVVQPSIRGVETLNRRWSTATVKGDRIERVKMPLAVEGVEEYPSVVDLFAAQIPVIVQVESTVPVYRQLPGGEVDVRLNSDDGRGKTSMERYIARRAPVARVCTILDRPDGCLCCTSGDRSVNLTRISVAKILRDAERSRS